jgi:hypothetical protein
MQFFQTNLVSFDLSESLRGQEIDPLNYKSNIALAYASVGLNSNAEVSF